MVDRVEEAREGGGSDLWVEEEMRRRRGEAESGRRRTTIN